MLIDKTVVITGASGGIGHAIAQSLHDAGAKLILVGRNSQNLKTLNRKLGDKHVVIQADISTESGRDTIVKQCQTIGVVDVLINNAGVGQFDLFEQISKEKISEIITVNLTSTILLTHCLLPLLQQQNSAKIINIGSTFGSIGFPGSSVYSASKFGIKGFSKSLSREMMGSSISVQYFAPRATKTSINNQYVDAMNKELGTKMDAPEQVAAELMLFIQTKKKQYFVGWPEKLFVRINGLFPGVVDGSIAKQLPVIKRFLKQAKH
ncbi:MAG: SDR family oxidoreductase [Cycloclasticus sp.]|nr:SDR family oxidoreductase [Cycloclasticus sp.]